MKLTVSHARTLLGPGVFVVAVTISLLSWGTLWGLLNVPLVMTQYFLLNRLKGKNDSTVLWLSKGEVLDLLMDDIVNGYRIHTYEHGERIQTRLFNQDHATRCQPVYHDSQRAAVEYHAYMVDLASRGYNVIEIRDNMESLDKMLNPEQELAALESQRIEEEKTRKMAVDIKAGKRPIQIPPPKINMIDVSKMDRQLTEEIIRQTKLDYENKKRYYKESRNSKRWW
jgi:hypothetical protein